MPFTEINECRRGINISSLGNTRSIVVETQINESVVVFISENTSKAIFQTISAAYSILTEQQLIAADLIEREAIAQGVKRERHEVGWNRRAAGKQPQTAWCQMFAIIITQLVPQEDYLFGGENMVTVGIHTNVIHVEPSASLLELKRTTVFLSVPNYFCSNVSPLYTICSFSGESPQHFSSTDMKTTVTFHSSTVSSSAGGRDTVTSQLDDGLMIIISPCPR